MLALGRVSSRTLLRASGQNAMRNVRGHRTRACPKCGGKTPHRTLYVKTRSGGKPRWFQLFWACDVCGSLNHIVLPLYRLQRVPPPVPSELAAAVVKALEGGPLDLDELRTRLKNARTASLRHVFDSDLAMVLEFLEGRGMIAEEQRDRTAMVLEIVRDNSTEWARPESCRPEHDDDSQRRGMVTLYAQKWSASTQGNRLLPVGVLCPNCQYQRIEV